MRSSPPRAASGQPCLDGAHSQPPCPHTNTHRKNALTAHLISPASSPATNFVMYLVKLGPNGATAPPPAGHERFVFFLDGAANLTRSSRTLHANSYSYFPPGDAQGLTTDHGAGLLVYERKYTLQVCCVAHQTCGSCHTHLCVLQRTSSTSCTGKAKGARRANRRCGNVGNPWGGVCAA